MSKFITAKDLAAELEMDARSIRRNQHALGLDEALDTSCRKPLRWFRDKARRILTKRGHIIGF